MVTFINLSPSVAVRPGRTGFTVEYQPTDENTEVMMSENTFILNGNEVSFAPGQTILEAAEAHDVSIPTLCHLKGTTPTGACRVCVVEVKGAVPWCPPAPPPRPGMDVKTVSPASSRPGAWSWSCCSPPETITAPPPAGWPMTTGPVSSSRPRAWDDTGDLCPVWGDCKLQELAFQYQVRGSRFTPNPGNYPMELKNPLIVRDFSRCILCGRCVQACNEVQVNRAISHGYRGV